MTLPKLSLVSNNTKPEASARRGESLRVAAGKTGPLARLEVLLRLEAPPAGIRGAPQFGESTVQEYVQNWLDLDVPEPVRAQVFRTFVPQIEPMTVSGVPGLTSYRSLMVRAWVENPCIFENHEQIATAVLDAAKRIQPLFLLWFDSGWMVKSVYRLRDLNGAVVPDWMLNSLQRLGISWVPLVDETA